MSDIEWTKGTIMVYLGFGIFVLTILLIILDIILSSVSKKRRERKEAMAEGIPTAIYDNKTGPRPTEALILGRTERSTSEYTQLLNTDFLRGQPLAGDQGSNKQIEQTEILHDDNLMEQTELLEGGQKIDETRILKANQQTVKM